MKKSIIRVGDHVKVIVPEVVLRVGYPKTVDDYIEQARAKYGAMLDRDMGEYYATKALRQIAYGLARVDGFSGRERSLHKAVIPDLLNKNFYVSATKTAKTGTYFPPSGCYDDYEPGGLANEKTHKLVSGFWHNVWYKTLGHPTYFWIPAENLEKIGGGGE